jgi:hypothetical protein
VNWFQVIADAAVLIFARPLMRQAEETIRSMKEFRLWEKQMQNDICNDWSATWTPEEFEAEFPFMVGHFQGPGWYVYNADYILVLDVQNPDGKYLFVIWFDHDPRQAMLAACTSLPEYHLAK